MITFEEFPKIKRISRNMVITEKIDGTNAQVIITEEGEIGAASRTTLIYPEKKRDNHGFAQWVQDNKDELLKLGPGRHFGEWWGAGVNKRYPGISKTFSLFDVAAWYVDPVPHEYFEKAQPAPRCCSVVPILHIGPFDTAVVDSHVARLAKDGSIAAPGCQSEGVVIWHEAARIFLKKTIEKDEEWKGKSAAA